MQQCWAWSKSRINLPVFLPNSFFLVCCDSGTLQTDTWFYSKWQKPSKSCRVFLCPSEVLQEGELHWGRDVCINGLICERVLNESQGVSGCRPIRFSVLHFFSPVCWRQAAKPTLRCLPCLLTGLGRKGLPHYRLHGLSLPVQTTQLGFYSAFQLSCEGVLREEILVLPSQFLTSCTNVSIWFVVFNFQGKHCAVSLQEILGFPAKYNERPLIPLLMKNKGGFFYSWRAN